MDNALMIRTVLPLDVRKRQAALVSIHHHSGRIVVPQSLVPRSMRMVALRESLRQLPADGAHSGRRALARTWSQHPSQLGPDRKEYLKRACAVAALNADRLEKHADSHGGEAFEFPIALTEGLKPTRPEPPDMGRPCSCCLTAAEELGIAPREFPVALHDHAAWVDLDSSVAWILIRLKLKPYEHKKKKVDWFDLFKTNGDPINWGATAESFFKGTVPIDPITKYKDGLGWRGKLREHVQFAWNESAETIFQNILHVDFRVTDGTQPTVKLLYSLQETEFSEVAGWRQDSGLDVDDGYLIIYQDPHKNVLLEVLKVVRYTPRPRPSLPGGVDLGQFLNFVAPSTVGLWLDAMFYEAVMGALRA
jgi:hypothetical protein